MTCTVLAVRNEAIFVETRRHSSQLAGCMWMADYELPECLRAVGCQFTLEFIQHPNGSCSSHIIPLQAVEVHTSAETVLTTLITLCCAQFLIELSPLTHHDPKDAPWVALTWTLTILIVCGWRWLLRRPQVIMLGKDDCP